MRPQPHTGIRSFAILFHQGLALARCYAKMALHGFTSTGSDKLLHLPSLGVKHFPFNVVLFSMRVRTRRFRLDSEVRSRGGKSRRARDCAHAHEVYREAA